MNSENELNVREKFSRIAYDDVLDAEEPTFPDNEEYMECYRFWRSIATERHFDPYY